MDIKINELNYNVVKKHEEKIGGNIIKHGVKTIDFIIDGKSLFEILIRNYDGHNDYMCCFGKGLKKINENSKNKLLFKTQPETENGRYLIYFCPECADIGCGAFCCKIKKENGIYKWNDFAYEKGDEEVFLINNIGTFNFNENYYEELINKIYKIMK
jgi:hypothetical protein